MNENDTCERTAWVPRWYTRCHILSNARDQIDTDNKHFFLLFYIIYDESVFH